MDIQYSQQQSQLKSLIQFAFAQRKFEKVIELIDDYHKRMPQQKQMYMMRAKAHTQLNKPQQCLMDLNNAMRMGGNTHQYFVMKIRSHIQLGEIKEAQKQLHHLLSENQQLKKVIQLKQAIDVVKDQFQIYKLSQAEQKILQNMKLWLQGNGATYPKLKIVKLYPGYRGAIATRHIRKKQPIVFVPKSQLITLQMAKANKYSQGIMEKKIKLQSPKHTFLSILLLQLKSNPESKFKPYIDLLPQDHSCFPINYSKQQLEMLEGSPFLNMIFQKVIDLKRDYESVVKSDPNFQKLYSFKQFCWARMMIGSRIFGLLISGIKTEVLVPFADMLNHRQPKQTIWNYQQSMHGFVIESLEDIQVGQQVFDSYGRKCNTRFLLNYGFVLQENPDNQISIKISIDSNDSFCAQKKQMIGQDSNQSFSEIKKINLNLNNNRFYELMGCLRFICVGEQQTLNMLKKISNIEITKQPYIMIRTPPISVKNQTMVWKKLLVIFKEQIAKYPNTIENDKDLLKKGKLTQNQKNIITLRMGQKHILTQFIKICGEVIEILQSPNILEVLEKNVNQIYARYLYKILCLTPGMNKKNLEKKLGSYFQIQSQEANIEETQQVAEH